MNVDKVMALSPDLVVANREGTTKPSHRIDGGHAP